MYQPWSTMQMPHMVPVHYHPYYSQPASFPVPPVVPPMSPFATPPASPFAPPMSPFAPAKPPSLLEQFKTKEGTYDITKMMNTMGQAVQVMNQMSGLVKGLTQTFKM
ncbi:spore coat-like protein [Anoxybacillus ayderensis]|uniref:YppG family protein n=1 Tax=Anoxybacillus sp. ST70 TaxID=2864180 RepID=UPI000300662B|nr:YppG family protein [Anoxybacillus sp. ST70]AXM90112.1 spore coat-like protein [Anoxybacillus ayderensis G10]MBW9218212.1 YppG family protein [Anoxybacillus sp. ST70]THD15861.1 spore coat-like protein [Anoxybacillus ayderensis]